MMSAKEREQSTRAEFDFDWLVIGSGFGGSVSALRLAEKGYKVAVLECGSRFRDEDFAESNLRHPRRYFWLPRFGFRGVMRMTFFKDVFIVSGSGVGGGSLGYANTLYRARPAFFEDPQWNELGSWERELAPHYDTAERMLGVVEYEGIGPADKLLQEYGEEIGVGETFTNTRVGVFFDKPGVEVEDPFFDGEGPSRTGCMRCGSCMVGCRHGAKNTLMKNYLWFAEKLGVEIQPERQVTEIRPLGAADGSDGYAVSSERSGSWLRKRRRTQTARGVIVAAGALGTNNLLANCRHSGALSQISGKLGDLVRTNSESIQSVTAPDDERDFSRSVAITSSIYPDPDTHIEVVTYGQGGDAMSGTFTAMTGPGTKLTRPIKWLAAILRHPLRTMRMLIPHRWSQRTVILLVMQTVDAAMHFRPKRKIFGSGVRLQTEQDPGRPNPTYIPAAEKVARWFEQRTGGVAQSALTESIRNIPSTAHILGGAVIGGGPESGVVDSGNRVFGYENLLICDGAAIPANPGVNPSLTITAKAEHAMSLVPPKAGEEPRHLPEAARPATPVAS
ncbi:MAG: cholesterol oxidase [Solirubrobacterales bacterium]|jgi:cholesterol oxidase|nr:cholesterol oxidase [Solirubrobacterales bacterium]